MSKCRYGKLKHPRGRRVCKKARSSKRRGRRRVSRRAAAGGVGGLLLLAGLGAGAYYLVQNAGPTPQP